MAGRSSYHFPRAYRGMASQSDRPSVRPRKPGGQWGRGDVCCRPGTVAPMAPKQQTQRRRPRLSPRRPAASPLGSGEASGKPAPAIARAIDAAYQTLQVVSETHARNQICAMLVRASRHRRADPDAFVRGSSRRRRTATSSVNSAACLKSSGAGVNAGAVEGALACVDYVQVALTLTNVAEITTGEHHRHVHAGGEGGHFCTSRQRLGDGVRRRVGRLPNNAHMASAR